MRPACLVVLLSIVVVGSAQATEYLQTLKEGSWVCTSPEAYDQAVDEQRRWLNGDLEDLKKQLLARKLCMYVGAEYVEKMMAPFAKVLERNGNKVKVSFTVDFRERIEFLHRRITRVTYVGWTAATNLIDKEIL